MEPVPLSALLAAFAPDSPLGAFVPRGCQKILAIGLREIREADLSFELEIRGQPVLKVTLRVREGQLVGELQALILERQETEEYADLLLLFERTLRPLCWRPLVDDPL